MVQDVKKAYFFADATRKIYIELPPEDHEPGKVGLLKKSLYGTRDAALNWTAAYTSVLVDKLVGNHKLLEPADAWASSPPASADFGACLCAQRAIFSKTKRPAAR